MLSHAHFPMDFKQTHHGRNPLKNHSWASFSIQFQSPYAIHHSIQYEST